MNHLRLSGMLNLTGNLKLAASNGKVMAAGKEVLVVVGINGPSQGTGVAVLQPPSSPIDSGTDVRIIKSFNSGVTIKVGSNYLPAVALGLTMQGNTAKIWPGMVLPSTNNTSAITINHIAINVKDDSAMTLPNGGTVNLNVSGQ